MKSGTKERTMIRCDRCRVRLDDMGSEDGHYRYNVGDRLPDRDGHATYKLRDDDIYLCNARRWPKT
jgi:hypothetical protein